MVVVHRDIMELRPNIMERHIVILLFCKFFKWYVYSPFIIHFFIKVFWFNVIIFKASLMTLIELARWVVRIRQLQVKIIFFGQIK